MKKKYASFYGNGDQKYDFNDFICYYCSTHESEKEVSIIECRIITNLNGMRVLDITGVCEKCEEDINKMAFDSVGYAKGPRNNDELQIKLKEFELSLVMES